MACRSRRCCCQCDKIPPRRRASPSPAASPPELKDGGWDLILCGKMEIDD